MAEATKAQLRAQELVEALWNDSSVGPILQKTAKSKWPEVATVDEQFAPVVGPLKAENEKLAKRLADLEAERAAEKKASEEGKQKQSLEAALEKARTKYNLTEEGFDKMVTRMKETGNYYDAEAAASWVSSNTPPVNVQGPTWAPERVNFQGSNKYDEAFKELHRNPEGYMDSQLSTFLKDPDGYVRETFGNAA